MSETYGIVLVSDVYLRKKPGGTIIGGLRRGERVRVLGIVKHKVAWAHVESVTLGVGYVVASALEIAKAAPKPEPPVAAPNGAPPDVAPFEPAKPKLPPDSLAWFLGTAAALAAIVFVLFWTLR